MFFQQTKNEHLFFKIDTYNIFEKSINDPTFSFVSQVVKAFPIEVAPKILTFCITDYYREINGKLDANTSEMAACCSLSDKFNTKDVVFHYYDQYEQENMFQTRIPRFKYRFLNMESIRSVFDEVMVENKPLIVLASEGSGKSSYSFDIISGILLQLQLYRLKTGLPCVILTKKTLNDFTTYQKRGSFNCPFSQYIKNNIFPQIILPMRINFKALINAIAQQHQAPIILSKEILKTAYHVSPQFEQELLSEKDKYSEILEFTNPQEYRISEGEFELISTNIRSINAVQVKFQPNENNNFKAKLIDYIQMIFFQQIVFIFGAKLNCGLSKMESSNIFEKSVKDPEFSFVPSFADKVFNAFQVQKPPKIVTFCITNDYQEINGRLSPNTYELAVCCALKERYQTNEVLFHYFDYNLYQVPFETKLPEWVSGFQMKKRYLNMQSTRQIFQELQQDNQPLLVLASFGNGLTHGSYSIINGIMIQLQLYQIQTKQPCALLTGHKLNDTYFYSYYKREQGSTFLPKFIEEVVFESPKTQFKSYQEMMIAQAWQHYVALVANQQQPTKHFYISRELEEDLLLDFKGLVEIANFSNYRITEEEYWTLITEVFKVEATYIEPEGIPENNYKAIYIMK